MPAQSGKVPSAVFKITSSTSDSVGAASGTDGRAFAHVRRGSSRHEASAPEGNDAALTVLTISPGVGSFACPVADLPPPDRPATCPDQCGRTRLSEDVTRVKDVAKLDQIGVGADADFGTEFRYETGGSERQLTVGSFAPCRRNRFLRCRDVAGARDGPRDLGFGCILVVSSDPVVGLAGPNLDSCRQQSLSQLGALLRA